MFFRTKRQEVERRGRCYSITVPAGIILVAVLCGGALLVSLMRNLWY